MGRFKSDAFVCPGPHELLVVDSRLGPCLGACCFQQSGSGRFLLGPLGKRGSRSVGQKKNSKPKTARAKAEVGGRGDDLLPPQPNKQKQFQSEVRASAGKGSREGAPTAREVGGSRLGCLNRGVTRGGGKEGKRGKGSGAGILKY